MVRSPLPMNSPAPTVARPRWRLSQRELFLIFVFWTSLATLSAVNRLLDPRGSGYRGITPVGPIAMAYIESWIWAVMTPLVFWLSSRFPVERNRWVVDLPLLLVMGVAISVGVYLVLAVAREELFETVVSRRPPPPLFAPLREIGRLRFVNHFLVYVAVVVAGHAREYYVRGQARMREAATLVSRTAVLQAQLADARLDALRMQLNPHFLFNTLHAIAALVERDPGGVRRMIARLSELLRLTMDSDAEHEVTLREELSFLRRYIEIMEIRFLGRLRIVERIGEDTLPALVPRLMLQPVVENALEHGAARAVGEGLVEIAARRRGDELVITVSDNGPGVDEQADEGVGVANTRARLAELHGEAASFTLTSRPEGGALAEITLPYRKAEHA
ncbi:MAG: histidine kinase internal region [Acidobacteria bacterium]|nr:histidine kinase internal region [Acidobacteriota bacterium]